MIEWKDYMGKIWNFDDMGAAIVSGKLVPPAGLLYDGKYLVVNQDPAVPISGFMVITLKRHVNSYSLLTKEEKIEIANILFLVEDIEKKLDISKEFTIVQEDRCPHYHIWIFPDNNWISKDFPRGIEKMREMFKSSKEQVTPEIIEDTLLKAINIKKELDKNKKIYGEKLYKEIL